MTTEVLPAGVPPALPAPVVLTMGGELTIDADMPGALRCAITRALTLPNPKYSEAEAHGYDTRDLAPELRYYRHAPDGGLVAPRGVGRLVQALCAGHDIACEIVDDTHTAPPALFDERITLSDAQERAVGQVLARRIGVLESPAGSGKTVMAMALIARRQQPALIIVHTKELAHQAIARAVAVLGLDEAEIGLVGDGGATIGQRLTVGLVQSLARGIPPALLDVGDVIVDEAHHAPAALCAAVVSQFPARFVTGLTATPFRRDGLDAAIGFYFGPIVATIDKEDLADRLITPGIIKRDTSLRPTGDGFAEIVSELVVWPARNALIVADVARAVADGRRCLVLSERVGHVQELTRLLLARGIAAAALYGSLGKTARGQVVADIGAGVIDVAVATGSLVGEGFDCPRLDALFLATPVSYHGRVVQYLGRVSRTAPDKTDAIVVDYCDDARMLWSTWKNRRIVYERQGCPIAMSPARVAGRGHPAPEERLAMNRDRKRENPLPPDEWVEVTTQFDDSDDERGRYLAARRRPYDAVEHEIAPVRPAFPSSPSEPFTAYLDDDVLRFSQAAEGGRRPTPLMGPRHPPAGPGMTLVEACRRLAAEEPALFACVSLCRIKGRCERAAAAELGIANGLVNERKWAGVAQLVVWSHRSEGEVEAWLDGLKRLWAAREAAAAAADGGAGAAHTAGEWTQGEGRGGAGEG